MRKVRKALDEGNDKYKKKKKKKMVSDGFRLASSRQVACNGESGEGKVEGREKEEVMMVAAANRTFAHA